MLIVYLQYSTHLHEDMHAQLSLAKKSCHQAQTQNNNVPLIKH